MDGTSGAVSLFATVGTNSGPGIGDVVFDKASRQFFVSDLDTGLIYRLSATGATIDTFDHGVAGVGALGLAPTPDDDILADIKNPAFNIEDPATWGYTPKGRRGGGMAVRDGRLYYAIADGPQVWSVGVGAGGFGKDARLEIDGTAYPGYAFDVTSTTNCYPGEPYRCFVDATLAKDQSTSFLVTVKLESNELPGSGACTVSTVSRIVAPAGGGLDNKDPGNDEQGGTDTIRPCPFTNIKISKSAIDDNSQLADPGDGTYTTSDAVGMTLETATGVGALVAGPPKGTPDLTKTVGNPGCGKNKVGDGWICGFWINFQNLGPEDSGGAIEFTEAPRFANGSDQLELRPGPGLDCEKRGDGTYICGTTQSKSLIAPAHGCPPPPYGPGCGTAFAAYRVDVVVTGAEAAEGLCVVNNDVHITAPLPTESEAAASASNGIPPECCGQRPTPNGQSTMSYTVHCAPGTLQQGLACVKSCSPGFVQSGTLCVESPSCPPGFDLAGSGCTRIVQKKPLTAQPTCPAGWSQVADQNHVQASWQKQTVTLNAITILCAKPKVATAPSRIIKLAPVPPGPAPRPCAFGKTLFEGRCVPACPDGTPMAANGSCGPKIIPQTSGPLPCADNQLRLADGSCPNPPPKLLPQTQSPTISLHNAQKVLACPDGQLRLKNGQCPQPKTKINIRPFILNDTPSNNGLH